MPPSDHVYTVCITSNNVEVACVRNVNLPNISAVLADVQARYPGREYTVVQQRDATPASGETLDAAPDRPPRPPRLSEDDQRGASLAQKLLMDSYQRAATVQAFCVEKMTVAAGEMNKRFLDQVDAMQTRHQAAIERLDTIAFERKMMEHEASARHLSDHFRRLAADERRANAPSIAEQLANHLVAILGALATGGLPTTQKREGEHG